MRQIFLINYYKLIDKFQIFVKLLQIIYQQISNYQKLSYQRWQIQSGGFLGRLIGPLLKTGLPLIKNVIEPLAKRVLIPLGLTAAASAADAGKKNIRIREYDNTSNIKWWNS